MSGIAEVLLTLGYHVFVLTGSDVAPSENTRRLENPWRTYRHRA